ncbi:hypothetical protein HETIRDRAFT_440116 [Heterobasidion irregulare TC 32-1]|uniref:Uncharacterized protein n=1 Tax=Heterobasidion irregulare (strain TC 32-1) TaxID=747525 RepID=W4K7V3_HETIT|nr:uncharacterized protein HETIRDRAFT_440116 [Heterobasidion irregulare TC 32-1]ETW81868.1 hypothetical protein HETIRDRAFT_440116 [Heterobasidion irregulare TC 32-1]
MVIDTQHERQRRLFRRASQALAVEVGAGTPPMCSWQPVSVDLRRRLWNSQSIAPFRSMTGSYVAGWRCHCRLQA